MGKNRYLYLGDKTGNRIFYSVEEDRFYHMDGKVNILRSPTVAFFGIIFYVWGRMFNLSELNYNEPLYVVCSAVIGILLALVFHWYSIRTDRRYFQQKNPLDVLPDDQVDRVLRQARGITRIYSFSRCFLLLLIVAEPFVIRQEKNAVAFFTYFVFWFLWAYLYIHFNLRERRKVLKRMKRQYLQPDAAQKELP